MNTLIPREPVGRPAASASAAAGSWSNTTRTSSRTASPSGSASPRSSSRVIRTFTSSTGAPGPPAPSDGKQEEFMKKVNQGAGESKEQILITDFWDTVYRPYVEKNLRHSTFRSYVRLYENQLKPHFLRGRFTFPAATSRSTAHGS